MRQDGASRRAQDVLESATAAELVEAIASTGIADNALAVRAPSRVVREAALPLAG